ncbi:hypothetical protein P22_0307 [Propionispora sp. 2/2-37]|uniref:WecB/TagA/CpsF family glycosyltransferase n=1 Tax=Propionispora sp. 2/2-37 TaxID=1677858 RepID=UPI0006BB5E92|nr:WecB/TagA/CpsF family glycosyltransferase [Propionispora sp. 2/2-37]CUH94241.1 hypothetical protein P22_0307 [Propionispora sp. 2/2-37]
MRTKIPVLDIMIDSVTMQEALDAIETFLTEDRPHLVATANAEMVMMAKEDQELACILNKADLVVPDGAGVVWAARYLGHSMSERVAGYDLTQRLLAQAARKGYRVFLFGGAPGVAEKAKETAERLYPGIVIVGTRNGYLADGEEHQLVDTIRKEKPAILLVALGVPKQEKWLYRNLDTLQIPVCIGVGGTFDVMAGNVRRAPLWMQQANLEWLFRLLCQPYRAIRMLALPRFVCQVIRYKKD